MAQLLAKNATKIAAHGVADKGEYNGHVKMFFDEINFPAAVFAISDTVKINGRLPAGARVVDAWVKSASLGTTGIFTLGHGASDDGSIVADPDAFLTAIDAGGQVVLTRPTAAAVGLGKKFDKEVDVLLTATEATDAAADDLLQVAVFYIVD